MYGKGNRKQYKEVCRAASARPEGLQRPVSIAASGQITAKNTIWRSSRPRCAARPPACYTTNKVCGAPIKVDRAHLTDGYAQAIVVNSGNANTCAANGVAAGRGVLCTGGQGAGHARRGRSCPPPPASSASPWSSTPLPAASPPAAAKLAATAAGQRRCGDRHHDHRHPQKRVRHPVRAGRQDLHRGCHRQGQRHDRPQHGYHAGLLHHRRRRLPRAAAKRRSRPSCPAPTTR